MSQHFIDYTQYKLFSFCEWAWHPPQLKESQ